MLPTGICNAAGEKTKLEVVEAGIVLCIKYRNNIFKIQKKTELQNISRVPFSKKNFKGFSLESRKN